MQTQFAPKFVEIVRTFVARDPKTWQWEMCVADVFSATGQKVSEAAQKSACRALRAEFPNRTFAALVWNSDNLAKAVRLIAHGAEMNGETVNFAPAAQVTEKK